MDTNHLNEHHANQGAHSAGEFLGMSGNSGWYLLGSAGTTILMVILLWGVLGVSLLLCLFLGLVLCASSMAYVFALKNNKPKHYDTDFFESALTEAGVVSFRFGPREQRLLNPFTDSGISADDSTDLSTKKRLERSTGSSRARGSGKRWPPSEKSEHAPAAGKTGTPREQAEQIVARSKYEQLQEKLNTTEELLEDALTETIED